MSYSFRLAAMSERSYHEATSDYPRTREREKEKLIKRVREIEGKRGGGRCRDGDR